MGEAEWRISIFLGGFVLLALWELVMPKRRWHYARLPRWVTNLSLVILNTVVVRLTLGALAVSAAVWAQDHSLGMMQEVALPFGLSTLLAVCLLDAAVWIQHWVTHKVPWLWRLHRVHHLDAELDVTTALRFHPLEIVLSLLFKASVIVLLGIDPWVVLLFEIILNASAMFTHANIRLPAALEPLLRWVICTPDMHRVHHSVLVQETHSNFGFFLSIWDRLAGTYRQAPQQGYQQMIIGLPDDKGSKNLWQLLCIPFKKHGSGNE